MKSFFTVEFTDWFGLEHSETVWAYNKDDAIKLAERIFGYPMTITKVYLNREYTLKYAKWV